MDNTHCYNKKCINGIALPNCDHEDCEGKVFFPAMALGTEDCFAYCSRECKAKVVMLDYDPEKEKPRNIKEIQLGMKRLGKQVKEREMQKEGRLL